MSSSRSHSALQAVKNALERCPSVSAGIVVTGVKPRHGDYAVYTNALSITA